MNFWLSKTVPQRTHMKHQIEEHGGRVVILEKDADFLLVDHLRKDNPPGTYSYQFVERSIRQGVLQELDKFMAGVPRASVRQPPMGPARRYREPFTAKDDQILYDWMKPFEQAGGAVSGNKIYQQLAAQHPNHTWQSWRERYLKRVRELPRPRTDCTASNSSIQPRPQHKISSTPIPTSQIQFNGFTEKDRDILLQNAKHILDVSPNAEDEMWREFAENEGKHSAMEWKNYFHTFIRPIYESTLKKKRQAMPRYSSISDTTERPRGNTNITHYEQKGGTASEVESSKTKRRRTLPDSFVPSDAVSRGVDRKHQSGSQALESCVSRSFSTGPLKPPSTSREGLHGQHMSSEQQEIPPQVILQKPIQGPQSGVHSAQSVTAEKYDAEDGAEEVDEWIRSRVRRGQGAISEEQVRMALRCTTMDDLLADKVLEYFQAGQGIPLNMKGVWSEDDDAALQGVDPRAIDRVEQKHGREEFDARFEYLMELCDELYGALYSTNKAYTTPLDS
ncbi:hypothetical protein MGYG_01451 [Nannizzia gypsea CBS 118893]|uniref:DNA-binding protein RAP1 n=1 Tax=Arthroderma gypseum (strain ATCC MYA-4604 / CBS 118893) TaxID=535722 RepID=E5R0X9_ARTGP|nr:hypothetical protein MGYG_01451 [Nannizzia gypsea CBS 118893]EFQ98421.1 hypothetical protein MGYG_01451 [Nannizzia gypsea CBS 118893]